ncbi:MAG: DUF3810 domain-containing protein [Oscillospiraceae bacterium]|nr:DUF3810 domain-containing protein [Oscillospiraceae bacterium]
MRTFFRRHLALHIWLASTLVALLLFVLLRDLRPVMNFWVFSVVLPFRQFLGGLTGWIPFSMAELITLLVVLTAIGLLVREIRHMRRKRLRDRTPLGHGLYRIIAGLLAIVMTFVSGLTVLYGTNFYADNFQERAGIFAQGGGTVDDLERVTLFFAEGLNRTAPLVPRDENGVFNASIEQIFDESVHVFRPLEEAFPFLTMRDRRPKPLVISWFMAMTDYVGFYFPFTGEANINIAAPRSQIPAIVLHEFAHQRGIASENEANFVAILAGVRSDNPLFAYSAYQMGFSYLSNALNRVAPERFRAIFETLSDEVHADFANIRMYHERRNPTAQRITNAANDRMLRSYGEVSGIESYGEVVDLLLVYF